jgi:hypothetical protein
MAAPSTLVRLRTDVGPLVRRGLSRDSRPLGYEPGFGPRIAINQQDMGKAKHEHPNLLPVARVGAVLVDLESGLTLGTYASRTAAEPMEADDDAGLTDLPALAINPRAKPSRNE